MQRMEGCVQQVCLHEWAIASNQHAPSLVLQTPLLPRFKTPIAPGTIPGSAFKLPFKCPLDHVFDLETWSRELSPDHGPNIEYRWG